MSKANKNDERDNKAIIQEIVNLRSEKVSLLGYDSYADYVLEERMAESKNKVQSFLEDLLKQSLPKAKEEVDEIKVFIKKSWAMILICSAGIGPIIRRKLKKKKVCH